jgi:hypothetical protein
MQTCVDEAQEICQRRLAARGHEVEPGRVVARVRIGDRWFSADEFAAAPTRELSGWLSEVVEEAV